MNNKPLSEKFPDAWALIRYFNNYHDCDDFNIFISGNKLGKLPEALEVFSNTHILFVYDGGDFEALEPIHAIEMSIGGLDE